MRSHTALPMLALTAAIMSASGGFGVALADATAAPLPHLQLSQAPQPDMPTPPGGRPIDTTQTPPGATTSTPGSRANPAGASQETTRQGEMPTPPGGRMLDKTQEPPGAARATPGSRANPAGASKETTGQGDMPTPPGGRMLDKVQTPPGAPVAKPDSAPAR
jgi:hypothetical protein